MERKEFYKEGNQVLTEEEYNKLSGTFEKVENTCNDLVSDLRDAINDVMETLWTKRSSTELKTENYTLINRFGDIGIIFEDDEEPEEISLDEIQNISTMLDIVSEII